MLLCIVDSFHTSNRTETILNDLNLADILSIFSARLPSPPPLLFRTLQCICCLLRLYCIPFFVMANCVFNELQKDSVFLWDILIIQFVTLKGVRVDTATSEVPF